MTACDFEDHDDFLKEFIYKTFNEKTILFCEQTVSVELGLYVPHSYLTSLQG